MDLIILGLLFSDESLEEAYKYSKAGVQMAPHMFQKRMIEGIESIPSIDDTVINVPPIGSYLLNYKKLIIQNKKWKNNCFEVGYLNLPIIKQQQQVKKIYKILKNRAKNGRKLYILIYSSYIPFLKAAVKVKKKFNNVRLCLLQTDPIPGIGDHTKNMTPQNKRLGKKILALTKTIDSFIVLTEELAKALEVGNRPYSVVECICNPLQASKIKKKSENICLYTGTTMSEYNIKDLVDAFKYISNGQLWICGFGDCDEYIQNISKEYSNIKHFGMLKSEEVQKLRDECDFLINPRRPTGTYTKYSFPSKTAEYLMSGKPTILYKLEGIPEEYDQYVNYLTSDSPQRLSKELSSIFQDNYQCHLAKAANAREFMITHKNPVKQAEKIINIIKNS